MLCRHLGPAGVLREAVGNAYIAAAFHTGMRARAVIGTGLVTLLTAAYWVREPLPAPVDVPTVHPSVGHLRSRSLVECLYRADGSLVSLGFSDADSIARYSANHPALQDTSYLRVCARKP